MTLEYTEVKDLSDYVWLTKHSKGSDAAPGDTAFVIGRGDGTKDTFYLNHFSAIEGTVILIKRSNELVLTPETHYSINYDLGKVTLTSAGITALGTDDLLADYYVNSENIKNSEAKAMLESAEAEVRDRTQQYFADPTQDDPSYRVIVDEVLEGDRRKVKPWVFAATFAPFIVYKTTVATDYTTGATTLTVGDASGFKESGVLTIGDKKVEYSSRTGNVLTVPADTPSISEGDDVYTFCVEVAQYIVQGTPTYKVAIPEKDFVYDVETGHIEILPSAFFDVPSLDAPFFPVKTRLRLSYWNAWKQLGADKPHIPARIKELTLMIAAKDMVQRVVKRSHVTNAENFNPAALNSGDNKIENIIRTFKRQLVAGTNLKSKI